MADNIRLSTFDRVVNIHQSVKLAQIEDINKAMLIVQLQQNQKLNALNRQLAEANNLNTQILENQINQLKREEEQRFYKALVFNCIEILDKIETVKDEMLQSYLVNIYKEKIKSSLSNSKEILEELTDKTETKKQIEKLSNLIDINSKSFLNSPFAKLNDLINDYKNLEESFDKSLNNLATAIKLIVVPSRGLFGMNKEANQKALNAINEGEEKYRNLLNEKKVQLDSHNLHDFLNQIKLSFPDFDKLTNEVTEIENHFKNKFNLKPLIKEQDPLFWEAAKQVILTQQCINNVIGAKFKIGYGRTEKIVEELKAAGIVGDFKRNVGYEVRIKNLEDLNKMLQQ